MADVLVDVQVYCGGCGAGICGNVTQGKREGEIHIDPCDKCLDEAKNEGFAEGNDEGYEQGLIDGKED